MEYQQILTANLNLADIVNDGGVLVFDVPPISFNENANKEKFNNVYWNCVDP